jgi:hypothetical protein
MSNKKPTGFDIAKALRPLLADIPQLGVVSLSVRSVSFLNWVRDGERSGRWSEARVFVRDLIRERARDDGGAQPAPDPERLAALTPEQLDAAADLIVAKAGPIFTSLAARQREEADNMPEDRLAPRPGETGSDRLHRLARVYAEDYVGNQRRLNTELKKIVDPFGDLRQRLDTVGAITRQLGPFSDLVAHQRGLAEMLGGTLAAAAAARKDQFAFVRASEVFASSALFEQHRAIKDLLADRASPLSTLQDTLRGLSPRDDLVSRLNPGAIYGDRATWTKLVSSEFGLSLSARAIAAIGGLTASAETFAASATAAQAAALLRPGFLSAANLALEGVIGRGVTADLLRDHDRADAARPAFFGSIIDSVAALDDPELSEAQRSSALQQVIVALEAIRHYLSEEYQKAGLLQALNLVVAVLALAVAMRGGDKEAQPLETRQAKQQIVSLQAELRTARNIGDEHKSRLRYVRGVVNLRAEPNRAGLLLRLVYPDQWVKVLDTKGDWARVEVYDYRSDAGVEGWVSRRNLRLRPE